jgi:hypothetical protein
MDCRSNEVPKHTPGKWFAHHWGDDNSRPIAIQSVRLDGVSLIGQIESNKMADARLIAAAPEMLEALKRILPSAIAYEMDNSDHFDEDGRIAFAEATIAKAEGRQQ